MDKHTLIDNCLKGNAVAQKELFTTYAPKMLGVCLRYMKNTEQAEDVLQDGFVKVFQKLNFFKREGSLEGWIRRIIVNTALDQIRKDAKYKNDYSLDQADYLVETSGYILENLAADDLLKLIHELPEGYRVVFNMYAIEGYSHKEIGEELKISENTSKSQYSRARAYLRQKLEELECERTR